MFGLADDDKTALGFVDARLKDGRDGVGCVAEPFADHNLAADRPPVSFASTRPSCERVAKQPLAEGVGLSRRRLGWLAAVDIEARFAVIGYMGHLG